MSGIGREILPEVQNWSETFPEVRNWSGYPPRLTEVVGRPSRRSGNGRVTLPEFWNFSGDTPGGS